MENIQTSIFKAYDFRGIYPTEIDADVMERMGRAFAIFANSPKILVGYDMRVSAPETSVAFIKGVTSAGVNVVDLGQISTDTIYFASGHYELPGAVITASHNPKEYTGVKFCKSGAEPIGAETGLEDIKEMVLKNEWKEVENMGEVEKNENILAEFSEHCHKFIDREKIKPLNIVIDAGNGMGGKIVPAVFDSLPFEITPLYFELDGNFPNHSPNPIKLENNLDLIAKVKEIGADLGIAFDGDADRAFFVDQNGAMIDSSFVTAMVAKKMLEKNPGSTIIYNVVVSKIVPEIVKQMGGKSLMSKVGHSYIKRDMKETGAVFAGEHSGHYYFKENFRADSGIITTLVVLQMLGESGKKMSELLQEFMVYSKIEETNFEVEDKDIIINKLKEKFADKITQDFDGVTFDFGDWWFNVRPSNTEPVLRLNLEAKTKEMMEEKLGEIKELITN
ncbi:MAG: phosphomannomutase/phosphoglucomutase [Candidatus Magasanikbacteria bacterium]|jgi:phosphomannomutase|nr:phosphomannomutase/phosphoglucomutase [Candidatus Magasanikbacteria bacterium]MBT4314537.1 phosphomannomutase/phosphoglucomutase [Candidatus Magasanikbacteria bacterium]MBT4547435.1 phosphomannomutase/phosphoglucomutase [Candidatus Magasanikbacteria bacterium]MBT6818891.1 phosphomannomutase/phosphoglucomutase [Candidatus Magasanikbacteria bacterium]